MAFFIPTPYFFSLSDQFSESELLVIILSELANPPDLNTNPYWEGFVGQTRLLYQRYTIGQFVRKSLDKNFPHWKMPKHWKKDTKEIINLEGNLLGQTWKLIKLLPSDQSPRPFTLYAIALEMKIFLFSCDPSKPTATEIIRENQSINRTLQSLSNPFCKEDVSATWGFVDRCHKFASRSDNFREDYMKLVSLRMSLTQKLKAGHVKILDQKGNIKEKRGRKSITPSRSRSE
jgi:hypothetical protein